MLSGSKYRISMSFSFFSTKGVVSQDKFFILCLYPSPHPLPCCLHTSIPLHLILILLFLFPGAVTLARLYHVQFFGDEVERGWIPQSSLLKYEGKVKFLEMAEKELCKHGKSNSKYNPFRVKDNRKQAWEVAVEEAEEALPLTLEERNRQYAFEYMFLTQEDLKKRKSLISNDSNEDIKSKRGRKRKLPSDDLSPKAKRKKMEKNANNSPIEASFEEYYAHHFSAVNEENPQWDENRVYEFLKKQWDMHEKSKERRKSNMESSPRPKKHGTLTMKHFFKSLHENEKGKL